MRKDSLLGEIGLKFVKQTENLASESLNYILGKSPNTLKGFNNLIRNFDKRLTEVRYTTQVYNQDDNAIPDLIGFNNENRPTVIIEAKFWAGLTKNQPVTYLKRLPEKTPAVLVFLIPEKRTSEVWSEIKSRMIESSISFEELNNSSSKRLCRLNQYHSLGIISWKETVDSLKSKLDNSSESSVISDINQLEGLCERIDSISFIPLSDGEITSTKARRNIDYCDLVDEIVDFGKEKKKFKTKGLNKGAKKYIYHRYFQTGDWNCKLSFDNYNWYNYSNTPIWLEVYGKGKNQWNDVNTYNIIKEKLNHLEGIFPKRMINKLSKPPLFPIYLTENKTKSDLIENAFQQITETIHLLN